MTNDVAAKAFFVRPGVTAESCRLGGSNHSEFYAIGGAKFVQKYAPWPEHEKWNFGVVVQVGNTPCAPFSVLETQ